MAIYYVRTDGNDTNAGTGPATNQAWQTITKAIGATGISPGDTLYIAPGIYRGSFTAAFTNPANEGQRITISGNPTASQFSGITPGPVIITNYTSTTATSGSEILRIIKSYVTLTNVHIAGYVAGGSPNFGQIVYMGGTGFIISKCAMYSPTDASDNSNTVTIVIGQSQTDVIVEKSVFACPVIFGPTPSTTAAWNSNSIVRDCIFTTTSSTANTSPSVQLYGGAAAHFGGIKFYNCYFTGITGVGVMSASNLSTTFPSSVQNSYFESRTGIAVNTNNGQLTESYNVFQCSTSRTNVAQGTGSVTRAFISPDFSMSRITGWANLPYHSPHLNTYPINAGLSTNAPSVDIYDVTWLTPSTPTIGPVEYFSNTATGAYIPTERNASTITIAPGSTSQSIELYLGATGLAFNTSGLSAYYIRNRSAPVAITLVTQTATGDWTSGGFAQINSSLTPGVYRLDLPDAAVEAGADDVTVVVRGASGTNGAVMTIKLSSGGLTAAQTAQAVLDAVASTHNNIGSIGAFIQDKSGYSLSTSQTFNTTGSVGSVAGNVTGNVVGTVGGVAGNVTGNIAGSVGTVATPDNIIDGVWDEQRVGHTASGSFGEKLQTNAMADEMLARDLGSGLNAGTAEERTVRSALRALRNKVNVGSSQMVVKKEDDTTDAWTASVTTTAVSSNVSGIDPN